MTRCVSFELATEYSFRNASRHDIIRRTSILSVSFITCTDRPPRLSIRESKLPFANANLLAMTKRKHQKYYAMRTFPNLLFSKNEWSPRKVGVILDLLDATLNLRDVLCRPHPPTPLGINFIHLVQGGKVNWHLGITAGSYVPSLHIRWQPGEHTRISGFSPTRGFQPRLMLGGFRASLRAAGHSNANGRVLLSAESFALLISRAVGYLRGQAFPSSFPNFRRGGSLPLIQVYTYDATSPRKHDWKR